MLVRRTKVFGHDPTIEALQIEVRFHLTATGGIEVVGSSLAEILETAPKKWATNRGKQTGKNRANGIGGGDTISDS